MRPRSGPLSADPREVPPGAVNIAWRVALIGAAAWFVYAPAITGGPLWDDFLELFRNPEVTGGGGLREIWLAPAQADYLPLKTTVQWLAWRLWGDSPPAFHLLNIGLHAASALLLWRLLSRMKIPGAWLGALLFTVHPLAVESVAWMAELKNTLSLPPLLLAALGYVNYCERRTRWSYVASLGAFTAALLIKASGVGLPLVLLLWQWWSGGRWARRDAITLAPFLAVAAAIGALTIHFQHTRAMADWGEALGGPAFRVVLAGLTSSFYLAKCILPAGLAAVYPQWPVSAADLVQILPLFAWTLVIAWSWRAREGWGRHALFALGAFLALAGPVLGFVGMSYQRHAWVADHFAYLPLIVWTGLLAAGGARLQTMRGRRGATTLAVVALAMIARHHAESFGDEVVFWHRVVHANPTFAAGHNNLGHVLERRGDRAGAASAFDRALMLNANFPEALINRGNALATLGRLDAAIADYERALQLDPQAHLAHNSLASALAQQQRFPEAVAHLERALALKPDWPEYQRNLGRLYVLAGAPAEALAPYAAAVQREPASAELRNDYGRALRLAGRLDDAAAQLREALRLAPTLADAHLNLGLLLYQQGDRAGALQAFESAARLDPASTAARNNLAILRGELQK